MAGALKGLLTKAVRSRRGAPLAERLIVGLGNPGEEYCRSRHNVGFMVVERLAGRWRLPWQVPRNRSRLATGEVAGAQVALLEPLTYMNLTGHSVARVLRELGLSPEQAMVVHDDVDLPLGRLRLRRAGSAGGHRGVQSTIDLLGTAEFARLRVGVGRPLDGDVRQYVLAPFAPEEREELDQVLERAASALECWLAEGMEAAMNRYNG